MLDADTKRRIDTARDLLVGKVPDPKSQVEQITIALIYKIMDAIDAESEEFGGRRSFFAGDFERYRWPNLVGPGRGGQETLNLYAEALGRMRENPGLPPLFRSIFDNAFLPYRDPETLREFLKVIDEFPADDPETLGDPFEYLLSVLGAQGDAGQFRTPRHIIDFIVQAVDPQKHETILDPACGTGGFLIAARQHIINNNSGAANSGAANSGGGGSGNGNGSPAPLTPDELRRLAANLQGYDISPDMVRLSRVNLYLHNCPAPQIYEYDTLTSEERWDERADVILANPPFMSPKGGIRPHGRFAVKARRSEALFVDYIAGHLAANGRAGVIVPEGVIFQAQRAYRQLRQRLVEQYLTAVVSLPAGVFQPYSGVKTSILFLDRARAAAAPRIAFIKVENDGFDLGAQRRPVAGSGLPEALAALREWREMDAAAVLPDTESAGPESWPPALQALAARGAARLVDKARIAADGDYNLSGERYRETSPYNSAYPMVALDDICDLVRGVTYNKADEVHQGGHRILRANNIDKDTANLDLSDIKRIADSVPLPDEKKLRKDDIFICLASGSKDHIGKVAFIAEDTDYYFGGFMGAVRAERSLAEPAYLFQQLRHSKFNDFLRERVAGANINNLGGKILYEFQIPLPPLAVQRELVAEIEGYQRVIDGAQAVAANYRPRIAVDPAWPVVALGEVCQAILSGGTPSTKVEEYWKGDIPWITSADIVDAQSAKPRKYITETAIKESATNLIPSGNIIVTTRVGLGRLFRNDFDVCISQDSQGLILKDGVNADYLVHILIPKVENFKNVSQGSTIQGVTKRQLAELEIPLPPLGVQQAIAAELAAEQGLVAAIRELAARMAGRIAAAAGRAWGGR